MPLFNRGKADGGKAGADGKVEAAGIAAFWTWWAGRKDAVAQAIEAKTVMALVGEIGQAVDTMDSGLAWELGPGRTAQHSFCVSSEGNIALRPTTERWLMAAPPPDETWEYVPARQGGELLVLEVGPAKLDQKAFRVGIVPDEGRRRLNVALFHPSHAGLPREAQLQSSFLFLDHCLGEDDVERWVGKVELAETEPAGAVSPEGLLKAVEAMRSMAKNLTFSLMRGQDGQGRPVFVSVAMSLKKIDYLFYDTHGEVAFPLGNGWPPDQKLLDAANNGEDMLIAALEGTAIYVGHITETGRRTLHFVAEDGAKAQQQTESWLRANSTLRGSAKWDQDPKWEFVRRWGG